MCRVPADSGCWSSRGRAGASAVLVGAGHSPLMGGLAHARGQALTISGPLALPDLDAGGLRLQSAPNGKFFPVKGRTGNNFPSGAGLPRDIPVLLRPLRLQVLLHDGISE